jgi:hypothetical protein
VSVGEVSHVSGNNECVELARGNGNGDVERGGVCVVAVVWVGRRSVGSSGVAVGRVGGVAEGAGAVEGGPVVVNSRVAQPIRSVIAVAIEVSTVHESSSVEISAITCVDVGGSIPKSSVIIGSVESSVEIVVISCGVRVEGCAVCGDCGGGAGGDVRVVGHVLSVAAFSKSYIVSLGWDNCNVPSSGGKRVIVGKLVVGNVGHNGGSIQQKIDVSGIEGGGSEPEVGLLGSSVLLG